MLFLHGFWINSKNMSNENNSRVREVLINIKEFLKHERKLGGPVISLERINDRVAEATGFSVRTVRRIVKEKKIADATSTKQVKIRKIRTDKVPLDLGFLQQKIHEFYEDSHKKPTIKKLWFYLKEEMGFKGSREIVRLHMKKLGYGHKQKNTGKVPKSNS